MYEGGGGSGVEKVTGARGANLNFVTPPPQKIYDNEISSIDHAICYMCMILSPLPIDLV